MKNSIRGINYDRVTRTINILLNKKIPDKGYSSTQISKLLKKWIILVNKWKD